MIKFQKEKLNILGGSPLFSEPHLVGSPQTPDFEMLLPQIEKIFQRNWLTNSGPVLQAFEQAICEYLGVRHCIAVCNGTMALMLLLKAMDLKGDVIVPSFTFPATVHALEWCGLKPIFCDVEAQNHNLDPECVKQCLSPDTSGILGVHLWGQACQTDALTKIAKEHELALMFDAAHAFGCQYQERFIGTFGDAEVFSFHATKLFHSLEGGAVVTNSDELALDLRRLINFGFENGKAVCLGINGKMNEVSAAVGLHNLSYLPSIIEHNRKCYEDYQALNKIPGIRLLSFSNTHNYQYIVIEIEPDYGLSRDELKIILLGENIVAKPYFDPIHQSVPYQKQSQNIHLPVTEQLAQKVLVLPTGQQMNSEKISALCELLAFLQANSKKIQELRKEFVL